MKRRSLLKGLLGLGGIAAISKGHAEVTRKLVDNQVSREDSEVYHISPVQSPFVGMSTGPYQPHEWIEDELA